LHASAVDGFQVTVAELLPGEAVTEDGAVGSDTSGEGALEDWLMTA